MNDKRFKISISILFLTIFLLLYKSYIPAIEAAKPERIIPLASIGSERANSLAFSPDGKLLTVGSSEGIFLFDVKTLSEIKFIAADAWVRSIAISQDGRRLAAGLFDQTIRLWSFPEGHLLQTFMGSTNRIRSIAFSPDGTRIASAADDDRVRIWDVDSGRQTLVSENNTEGVRTIAFSPDGRTLATGTRDGKVHLWRLSDGFLLKTLKGHQDWVRCLAFSPDGRLLASGSFDKTVKLWDVADGRLLQSLEGHSSSVLSVAFSPDGSMLASGSVDTAVGLWRVNDGSLMNILEGHKDFVFSVAFSPDGKLLASGSKDNTVRIWNMAEISQEAAPTSQIFPATPSDCRKCHHPIGQVEPARVLETRCEACHENGASLNWCPAFPRAPLPESLPLVYTDTGRPSGFPLRTRDLSVSIATPSNGETLYTKGAYEAPVVVSGKVDYIGDPEKVTIGLDVWSDGQLVTSLTNHPNKSGLFHFNLDINPMGSQPSLSKPSSPDCAICHEEYVSMGSLPGGEVHLLVTAISPEGDQASDERWIAVDVSNTGMLDVSAIDTSTNAPVPGLTIQAYTRLYQWRDRGAVDITEEDGSATLTLETLSQAPTVYEVSVSDQVVNGMYYSGKQAEQAVFPAGAITIQPVTIEVYAQKGQINGRIEENDELGKASISIWAVRLPAGPGYRSETTLGGHFIFADLPIASYAILPDPDEMAMQKWVSDMQIIDLTHTPETAVTITPRITNSTPLKGTVGGNRNDWLPFAWLVLPNGDAHRVDPSSGAWIISNIAPNQQTFVVNAPGYYSQSIDLAKNDKYIDGLDIMLQRRPETQSQQWGDGEIVIPPDTEAEIGQNQITLESGWIWGYATNGPSVVIRTPEAEITLSSGKFSFEHLPGELAWFNLISGKAEVRSRKGGETTGVQPGTMVVLSDEGHFSEMPYRSATRIALFPTTGSPLAPVFQPSVTERISDQLSHLGINLAMVITFITYAAAILLLALVPFVAIKRLLQRRNTNGDKKGGSGQD